MITLRNFKYHPKNKLELSERFVKYSTLIERDGDGIEDVYITNATLKFIIVSDFCKKLYLNNIECEYIYCIGKTEVILNGNSNIKYIKCSSVSHKSPETDIVSRIYTDDMINNIYSGNNTMPFLEVYIDDNLWLADFEHKLIILSKLHFYTSHDCIRYMPNKIYDLLKVGISEFI